LQNILSNDQPPSKPPSKNMVVRGWLLALSLRAEEINVAVGEGSNSLPPIGLSHFVVLDG